MGLGLLIQMKWIPFHSPVQRAAAGSIDLIWASYDATVVADVAEMCGWLLGSAKSVVLKLAGQD